VVAKWLDSIEPISVEVGYSGHFLDSFITSVRDSRWSLYPYGSGDLTEDQVAELSRVVTLHIHDLFFGHPVNQSTPYIRTVLAVANQVLAAENWPMKTIYGSSCILGKEVGFVLHEIDRSVVRIKLAFLPQ